VKLARTDMAVCRPTGHHACQHACAVKRDELNAFTAALRVVLYQCM